ncbi:hypothetical protein cgR_2355 [Corynebacterium glutamicum R]|uniref:Uncharacterized protein n=1 Tax=Corynebacterium glutamicum (strain R) TaxID=340322 RepID=A0AB72VDA3_CORGB|nr:hypothetical protein cgR_2355 [Corynebacterium glutamicum R]
MRRNFFRPLCQFPVRAPPDGPGFSLPIGGAAVPALIKVTMISCDHYQLVLPELVGASWHFRKNLLHVSVYPANRISVFVACQAKNMADIIDFTEVHKSRIKILLPERSCSDRGAHSPKFHHHAR